MSEVTYLPVEGFLGYRVGNDGSIWSERRGSTWRQLKPGPDKDGYPFLTLRRDGKRCKVYPHRLVLLAFVGVPPPNTQARHLDGNRANPALVNMAWGTVAENMADRESHGNTPHGTRNGRAKLDPEKVRVIRSRPDLSPDDLAAMFNVSEFTVRCVLSGRTWKRVSP